MSTVKMHRLRPERLTEIIAELLSQAGSVADEALVVSRHLVDSDLVGYHSHGVRLLPVYMRHLEAGWLRPNTEPRTLQNKGSLLAFDGGLGYGRRVMDKAMEAAIAKCRTLGTSIIAVSNAHHIGRVGTYGEIAANAGFVSLFFCNSVGHHPIVAPFGGRHAKLSTNPMCFAMPATAQENLFLLDIASSRTSYFKTLDVAARGEPTAEGMLLDSKGCATTDPAVLMQTPPGALLPFGDHKGFGLAVFSELLAVALSGGKTICSHTVENTSITNVVGILIDPAAFPGATGYAEEALTYINYLKATEPQDACSPVVIPGERLRRSRAESQDVGVPISTITLGALIEEAQKLGLRLSENDFGAA